MAYVWGIIVLAVLWILCGVIGNAWNPWKLISGADGRPSTSKLQWFIWTVVVIFSYIVLYAAKAMNGHFEPISEISENLLIAMGFSIVTMAAAKGITVSYIASGRIVKTTDVDHKSIDLGPIFKDDENFPDLSKIQIMAWTLISVVIYLISVVHQVNVFNDDPSKAPILPDIDPALMVLMGLGQGAYLGKKLTTTTIATMPRIDNLSPFSGKTKAEITITGMSFGESQKDSLITIDGSPLSVLATLWWQDNLIRFILPDKHPNGENWSNGQQITIRIKVGGIEINNTLPFTVIVG